MRDITGIRIAGCVLLALCICLAVHSADGMPLRPQLVEQLRANGELDRYIKLEKTAQDRGFNRPAKAIKPLHRLILSAAEGPETLHVALILADFDDKPADYGTAIYATPEMFDSVLFSHGLNPTGSMAEFYEENSWNRVTVVGDVYGWYRMPKTYAYYCDGQSGFGTYPQNASKLVEDACTIADPDVDFSFYDNPGIGWMDGYADGLIVAFSGPGAEGMGGGGNLLWSHVGGVFRDDLFLDGVQIQVYALCPEESFDETINKIGVYCHEYGHVLGLPDLYDYGYDTDGIGYWSLMASGSWGGGDGSLPVHFDAWCKSQLGWLEVINIDANTNNLSAPAIEFNPVAYRLWKNGSIGPEYFLISNRAKYGYDTEIPGVGLMIYHVDENVWDNDDNWHRLVDVEQADGNFDLNKGRSSGDQTDPWYAPLATDFDDFSIPSPISYDGDTTHVAVFDISTIDSIMTFSAEIEPGRPYLYLQSVEYSDSALGDGDGILDPGETVEVYVSLINVWASASDVEVRLLMDDPLVSIVDSVSYIGFAPPGLPVDNHSAPLRFTIDPAATPVVIDARLWVTAGAGSFDHQYLEPCNIGPTQFLIVDDDDDTTRFSYHKYFVAVMDSLRISCDLHDVKISGPVDAGLLGSYPHVVWFTGDHRSSTVTSADVSAMREFLEGGGRLLLTGQDIIQDISLLGETDFLHDFLHVDFGGTSYYPLMESVSGDPITDGLAIAVNSTGGAANQSSLDILLPLGEAEPIFYYGDASGVAGIRFESVYRLVILGFGMEGIADLMEGYDTRKELFGRIWDWWRSVEPGDFNGDRIVNAIDVVILVNYLFRGGILPAGVSGDVNGSCRADMGDAVYLVNYVFRNGPPPVVPCSNIP